MSEITKNPPTSGTDYDSLRAANPYAKSTRKESGWDKLVHSLGFNSGYDLYNAEREQNSANYLAQIDAMQREEMYNSSAEQVERERAAGINPEVAGGVDAGSSSGTPSELSPTSDMSDAIRSESEFTPVITSAFDALLACVHVGDGIASIVGRGRSIDSAELALGKDFSELAEELGSRSFDWRSLDDYLTNLSKDKQDFDFANFLDSNFDTLMSVVPQSRKYGPGSRFNLFRSKRLNDKFSQYWFNYTHSPQYKNTALKSYREWLSNKQSALETNTQYNVFFDSFKDYTDLVNTYYLPTLTEHYKSELETLRAKSKSGELSQEASSYGLEELAYKRSDLRARSVVINNLSDKIQKLGSNADRFELLFYNTLLNSLQTDYIKEAMSMGGNLLGDLLDLIPKKKISTIIHRSSK